MLLGQQRCSLNEVRAPPYQAWVVIEKKIKQNVQEATSTVHIIHAQQGMLHHFQACKSDEKDYRE